MIVTCPSIWDSVNMLDNVLGTRISRSGLIISSYDSRNDIDRYLAGYHPKSRQARFVLPDDRRCAADGSFPLISAELSSEKASS